MKNEPLLTFSDVSFAWSRSRACVFQNISFSLMPGDVIHLDAPSGTGKTTFLKLAAGLLKPTMGTISPSKGRIGFAFQEPRLLPWLTVLENLRLVQDTPDNDKALSLLKALGLDGKALVQADRLSGGEAQRVSLIRSIINSPSILLLDEPFNGLDEALRMKTAGLIQNWLTEDTPSPRAIIIVSHIRDFTSVINAKSVKFPDFSKKN